MENYIIAKTWASEVPGCAVFVMIVLGCYVVGRGRRRKGGGRPDLSSARFLNIHPGFPAGEFVRKMEVYMIVETLASEFPSWETSNTVLLRWVGTQKEGRGGGKGDEIYQERDFFRHT
jgi:hypothetical protein